MEIQDIIDLIQTKRERLDEEAKSMGYANIGYYRSDDIARKFSEAKALKEMIQDIEDYMKVELYEL